MSKVPEIRHCHGCPWYSKGVCLHPKAKGGQKPFPGCVDYQYKTLRPPFIDYILGALVAVYYSYRRLFSRGSRCPESESGIHLWVVRDGDYRCRDCGKPQTRVGPGADGIDR